MNKNVHKVKDVAKAIIKKKDDEIKLLKTQLINAQGEKAVVFKMPDSVEVRNLPEIQKVQVENQPEIQDVNVLNLKDLKDFVFPDVQKVQLVNPETQEGVKKVEVINDKSAAVMSQVGIAVMKGFSNLMTRLWSLGLTVKLADEERLKPLPVIVVDRHGRPVGVPSPSAFIIPGNNGRSGGWGPSGTLGSGQKTVTTAGSRTQLTAAVSNSVTIKALVGNSGTIYVGGSNVSSSNGFALAAGDTVSFDVSNVGLVYIDSSVNGEGISYIYI